MSKTILITGVAGFIGFHTAHTYVAQGYHVVGIDNLNSYYDPQLKKDRLKILAEHKNFVFDQIDIQDRTALEIIFKTYKPSLVIHLAAQAGVRYSIENPQAYIDSNITGFLNILEMARAYPVEHMVYASSSSVYGGNTKLPFSIDDRVDNPISLYAATKKSNELMAHTYAHLFHIPLTGLRFFTVYGPWGRPDMAYFKFAKAIVNGDPIDVYNNGDMSRDFTYIDDIVNGIVGVVAKLPTCVPSCAVYNIGHHSPEPLLKLIECLEHEFGKTATKNFMPMQAGDVKSTYADIEALTKLTGFKPTTNLETGIHKFATWYKEYYNL
jgi:UDP-glucuronate 4-epimerase